MKLIPVLEIRHGKAVHTEPKNAFAKQVINSDPLESVKSWMLAGINTIHIVDVDAVEQGEPVNFELISDIKAKFPLMTIQISGGINSIESAFIYIDAGADYLVLSGRAVKRERLLMDICMSFAGQVIVEIDCRDGLVEKGLYSGEDVSLSQVTGKLKDYGVKRLIVTDIPETGHVNYQNIQCVDKHSFNTEIPMYANGGINSLAELDFLKADFLKGKPLSNLAGILLGKIIYEKSFNLDSAVKALSRQRLAS